MSRAKVRGEKRRWWSCGDVTLDKSWQSRLATKNRNSKKFSYIKLLFQKCTSQKCTSQINTGHLVSVRGPRHLKLVCDCKVSKIFTTNITLAKCIRNWNMSFTRIYIIRILVLKRLSRKFQVNTNITDNLRRAPKYCTADAWPYGKMEASKTIYS